MGGTDSTHTNSSNATISPIRPINHHKHQHHKSTVSMYTAHIEMGGHRQHASNNSRKQQCDQRGSNQQETNFLRRSITPFLVYFFFTKTTGRPVYLFWSLFYMTIYSKLKQTIPLGPGNRRTKYIAVDYKPLVALE